MTKQLSQRQAYWAEILSAYSFTTEYLNGKKNSAERISQRPDYDICYNRPYIQLLATEDLFGQLLADFSTDIILEQLLTILSIILFEELIVDMKTT